MNRRISIVDTNIVVAGLLTADNASPVARVLDGMLDADFDFVLSEALLREYRSVLLRPPLRKRHGLTEDEVEALLVDLTCNAIMMTPGHHSPLAAPDPGDQFLWDLLAERADLVLVTGDKRLVEDPGMPGRVVTAHAFLAGA